MTLRFGVHLTATELDGPPASSDWGDAVRRGRAPGSDLTPRSDEERSADLAAIAGWPADEVVIAIEWSRLRPSPDDPDEGAVERTRTELAEARRLGLRVWACLVDGPLPGWFVDDERGFTDDRTREVLWSAHVDWVGETFGDLVDGWIPRREPLQWVLWGNLLGAVPPYRSRRRDASDAAAAVVRADLLAARLLRGSAPVAIHQTVRRIRPAHPTEDPVRADRHAGWARAGLASWYPVCDTELVDEVVLQWRPAVVVDGEGHWAAAGGGRTIADDAEDIAELRDRVGDRSVVLAADLGVVADSGAARADQLTRCVEVARDLGLAGWRLTSPIDGWHWADGHRSRPGLVDRDRAPRPVLDRWRSLADDR